MTSVNGTDISLFYKVSLKGHYSNEWNYYPNTYSGNNTAGYYPASSSDYTTMNLGFSSDNGSYLSIQIQENIPAGGQVDIQVQAALGYISTVPIISGPFQVGTGQVFSGLTSGWSNTQTITIPEPSTLVTPSPIPSENIAPSPTGQPTPTSSPPVPEFPTWTPPATLALGVFSVAVAAFAKRRKK